MTFWELGKFEGRRFVLAEPLIMPDGRVVTSVSVSEARREEEIIDAGAAAHGCDLALVRREVRLETEERL